MRPTRFVERAIRARAFLVRVSLRRLLQRYNKKIEVTGVLAIFRFAESLLLRHFKFTHLEHGRMWGVYPECPERLKRLV